MIEFLYKLFIGHRHEWEILDTGRIVDDGLPVGNWYNVKCKHCGKIKRYNVTT